MVEKCRVVRVRPERKVDHRLLKEEIHSYTIEVFKDKIISYYPGAGKINVSFTEVSPDPCIISTETEIEIEPPRRIVKKVKGTYDNISGILYAQNCERIKQTATGDTFLCPGQPVKVQVVDDKLVIEKADRVEI